METGNITPEVSRGALVMCCRFCAWSTTVVVEKQRKSNTEIGVHEHVNTSPQIYGRQVNLRRENAVSGFGVLYVREYFVNEKTISIDVP